MPKLMILPPSQLKLWQELSSTPRHFILYGGTAIALRLGHRVSVDFVFFSPQDFDPDQLYRDIPYLKNARILQQTTNTLTCRVEREGEILVSFFGGLTIGQIFPPSIIDSNLIQVASLHDLAGTKAAVIQKRVELKDYLDINAILTLGKLNLETILGCGHTVYDTSFNPYITLKALCYFNDPEISSLDIHIKNNLKTAVESVDLGKIPKFKRKTLGEEEI